MTTHAHDGALRRASVQAYLLLGIGFTLAPILFGIDKFFNWTVDWTAYLAPWVDDIAPGTAQQFMYFVGVTETATGLLVAVAPRIGALVVAGWLAGIILNLLTVDAPTYYDLALLDVGLLLAALALGRLAWAVEGAPSPFGSRSMGALGAPPRATSRPVPVKALAPPGGGAGAGHVARSSPRRGRAEGG